MQNEVGCRARKMKPTWVKAQAFLTSVCRVEINNLDLSLFSAPRKKRSLD